MFLYILLGQVQHLLEATPGWTEEQQIISIPYTTSKVVTDEATTLILLEYGKETVHIKIKEYRGDHCTLPDSISYLKFFRHLLLPSDICCLFSIDEYKHPDDNFWDFGF